MKYGLRKKSNLRDQMDTETLCQVILAEQILADRIEEEMPLGNSACIETTRRVATEISVAFDKLRGKRL
jgi:hypothetical protein